MVQADAGTSTGKLFHYFPTKQALILAVIEDQNRQVFDWIAELSAAPDPLQALDLLMDGVWHAAAAAEERRLVLEIAAESARSADANALTVAADRQLAATIAALVGKAVERGLVASQIAPARIACLVMAWIDGIFSRAGADPDYLANATPDVFRAGLRALLGTVQASR